MRARITGLIAGIEVTQVFRNPYDEPLEATYIFPLPGRAAVTGMRMEADGRVVVARAEGARGRRAPTTTRRSPRAAVPRSPRRSGRTCSRCGWATSCPPSGSSVRLTLVQPAALRGRRGHLPVPAGGGAAVHPRGAVAGTPVGSGWARRHRRGARRVPDHAAGPAARRRQPGAAVDRRGRRPGRPPPGGGAIQPARRGPRAATGSASSPASGWTGTSCSGWPTGRSRRPRRRWRSVTARSGSPCCRRPRRQHRRNRWAGRRRGRHRRPRHGRATSSCCWTARAAWAAGRWWPPAGPRHASSTP